MIRINLLGSDAGKKGSGLSAIPLPELSGSVTQVGIAAMFVVALFGVGFAWWYQSSTLKRARIDLALVQAERARVQEVADEVNALQERNDLMRQKLDVIVELKANQTGPVMLLDEISSLVTDGLWLTRDSQATHAFGAAGTFTVTLTIRDNFGATSVATATVTVTGGPGTLTASFVFAPDNPVVGQVVSFDATSSLFAESTLQEARWTWGDGSSPTLEADLNTTHIFTTAGTFTVTLTIRDSTGATATTNLTVTVS